MKKINSQIYKYFFGIALTLLLIAGDASNLNAQNTTGNPWQSWVPEISNGTETPKAAFAYTSTNGKLTATINNTCESYGIGNDKRGYIYYANMTTSLIYCVDPATETVVSTFGFTSGGAKIVSPHSFKCIYIAATNKHYLIVSNSGPSPVIGNPGSINTDGIVTILDVTNPAAMVFEKNITVPSALATGSRATGMDLIQTAYASAGTSLYIVVDNLRVSGFGGGLITIADPLNATPAITVFLTRDGLGTTNFAPHSVLADAVNNRLYVSGSAYNFILSFTLTGTPTFNTYRPVDGDGNEPVGLHTMMLNKAGTLLYAGSTSDGGGNRAYTFTVQSDKTSATVTTINQTAKSAVLNYSGNTSGYVMGVNLLPDGSKLYGVLESNGSGNTAKIYDLNPTTLATNGIIQNKAGTADATFGYLDPHSYAFTLQDYGDAPATYGTASHFLSNDDYLQDRLRIGATIDGDSAAVYSAGFNGDDIRATPKTGDEDGITPAYISSSAGLYYGMTGTYAINGITVQNTTSPSVTANLVGWIDFNHDGIFQSTEGVSVSVPNGTTSVNLSWTIPANVSTGPVLLRLRLSSDPALTVATPSSAVFDGEVEDHKFPFPIPLSGTVFNDINANTIFGSTGTSGSGESGVSTVGLLYAYLIIGGIIVDSSHVTSTGIYNFPNAPQNAGTASIVIGTNSVAPGTVSSDIINIATNPPSGWVFTGSSVSTTSNALSNSLNVSLSNVPIVLQNFGIQERPTATSSTMPSQVNNQDNYSIPVPGTQFGGTDFSGGTVEQIRITSFPTNTSTITIDGIKYGTGFTPLPVGGVTVSATSSGQPIVPIYLDPVNGITSAVISYVTLDNAGAVSPVATVTIPFTVILSVTGLEIDMTNNNNCEHQISWQTLTEVNALAYELQYSTDGNAWKQIATISAIGNSNSRQLYQYVNTKPAIGKSYYRIKAIDRNGSFMYSSIKSVATTCKAINTITVYPNPVKAILTVIGAEAGSKLIIADVAGKIMLQAKASGSKTDKLSIGNMATGMYLLQVINLDGIIKTFKINKQ